MILNEFEAVTNLANGPIIFTYDDESEASHSSLQYLKYERNRSYNGGGVICTESEASRST